MVGRAACRAVRVLGARARRRRRRRGRRACVPRSRALALAPRRRLLPDAFSSSSRGGAAPPSSSSAVGRKSMSARRRCRLLPPVFASPPISLLVPVVIVVPAASSAMFFDMSDGESSAPQVLLPMSHHEQDHPSRLPRASCRRRDALSRSCRLPACPTCPTCACAPVPMFARLLLQPFAPPPALFCTPPARQTPPHPAGVAGPRSPFCLFACSMSDTACCRRRRRAAALACSSWPVPLRLF